MADSVGQIGLDLVVNKNGFNKQMQSIAGLAKKAGAVLAGAFAVKKLVDFGAQAIELGSDLNEVQNVVDVTFTSMSAKVDAFAKKAATNFGLSETMAKQYTGTFGAMAKAFGFTEGAAYDMSTTLTGLAGDVASFYNISQDEAYTKLKSVFTGETESLKDLGVVMTQAALDQFALANGYGKTTAKMNEGEKVALRYAFVTKQLSLASGDFIRTSGGWANQVRVLNLQFSSFKATIGQGLINLFTPIIQVINVLLGKLQTLANAFKSFTELITGKKSQASNSGVSTVAADADAATTGLNGVTDAAKKAAKATSSLNIDELNIVSPDTDSSGTGTDAGADTAGVGLADQMATATEDAATRAAAALDALKKKLKEISDIFTTGFKTGLGDVDFSKITSSAESIKKSLAGIFLAPEVVTSADKWADAVALSLGKITGSVASVGTTLATLLTGSIAGYLDQNAGFIKDKIVSIFDASARAHEISGNLAVALAGIFTVFQTPQAQQIGADLIAIFANSYLSIAGLAATFGADLISAIAQPILDNQGKIKTALENTLSPIETVVGGIKDFVGSAFQSINNSYNNYIAPALTLFSNGFSNIFSTLLDNYNTYLAPVLQNIADKFSALITQHINPLVTAFTDLAGGIVLAVAKIWNETLSPFIAWVIDNLAPPFSTALDKISGLFMSIAAVIADVITKALEKLGEFVGWIGDNQETIINITTVIAAFFAAWEVIKLMSFIQQSGGVVSALSALIAPLTTATTAILANAGAFVTNTAAKIADKAETVILTAMYAKDFVASLASGTAALVTQAAQWVASTAVKVADTVAMVASTAATVAATAATWLFNAALAVLTSPITLVVAAIAGLIAIGVLLYKNWDTVKKKASEVWLAITDIFTKFDDFLTNIFAVDFTQNFGILGNILNAYKESVSNIWDSIKTIFSGVITFISGVFTGDWRKAWQGVQDIFKGIFEGLVAIAKAPINIIIGLINAMVSGVESAVNMIVSAVNRLSFTVPDWVPSIGGKSFGFSLPTVALARIPYLAQGGYVKANTPQLAMIGDNLHQGEVVAPEDKLLEMAMKAAELTKGNGDSVYMPIVIDLLNKIINILEALDLNLELDGKSVLKGLKDTQKRLGFQF